MAGTPEPGGERPLPGPRRQSDPESPGLITDVDTERRSRSGTRAGIVLQTLVLFFPSRARPKGSLRVGRAGPGRCPGCYDPPTNPKPMVRARKRNVVPRGGRGSGDGGTGWGRARRRRARAAPRPGSRRGGGERAPPAPRACTVEELGRPLDARGVSRHHDGRWGFKFLTRSRVTVTCIPAWPGRGSGCGLVSEMP